MSVCACCDEAAAPALLLPCLTVVCAACRDDLVATQDPCAFCAEAACDARRALVTGAGEALPLCAKHAMPHEGVCRRCPASVCRACTECCGRSVCFCAERTGALPPTLAQRLSYRQQRQKKLAAELAELEQELDAHYSRELVRLRQAFEPADCDDVELRRWQTLSDELGAHCRADLKGVQSERERVAHDLHRIDEVLQMSQRLAETRSGVTPRALGVARRAAMLLREPETKAPLQNTLGIVCAPKPYTRKTRACAGVHRALLRRARNIPCLATVRMSRVLAGRECQGITELPDGRLLASFYQPPPKLGGGLFVDPATLAPASTEMPAACAHCDVSGRLPNGDLFGLRPKDTWPRVASRFYVPDDALCAVDPLTGALKWTARADSGTRWEILFNAVTHDGIIIVTCIAPENTVMAFLPDGSLHWQRTLGHACKYLNLSIIDRDRFLLHPRSHGKTVCCVHDVHTGDLLDVFESVFEEALNNNHKCRHVARCWASSHSKFCTEEHARLFCWYEGDAHMVPMQLPQPVPQQHLDFYFGVEEPLVCAAADARRVHWLRDGRGLLPWPCCAATDEVLVIWPAIFGK